MEPLSALLVAAFVASPIKTSSPKWQPTLDQLNAEYTIEPLGPIFKPSVGMTEMMVAPKLDATKFPSGVKKIVGQLKSYARLGTLYGESSESKAPLDADIKRGISFIESFPAGLPLPSPMLSSDGELGFYWDSSLGYADLHIEPSGTASFFFRRRDDDSERFFDDVALDKLDKQWFFEAFGHFAGESRLVA